MPDVPNLPSFCLLFREFVYRTPKTILTRESCPRIESYINDEDIRCGCESTSYIEQVSHPFIYVVLLHREH